MGLLNSLPKEIRVKLVGFIISMTQKKENGKVVELLTRLLGSSG